MSLNTAVNSLTYQPDANFNGNAQVLVSLTDTGLVGNNALDSFGITVSSVNDAPINTVTGAQSVAQDGFIILNDALSVTDPDSSFEQLTVNLSVTNGSLQLSGINNLTVVGNSTSNVGLTGVAADINTALNGLRFTPDTGFTGIDTLVMNTTDGTATDIDNVSLTIQVPTGSFVTVPAAQVIGEDENVFFPGTVSVSTALTGQVRVQIFADNGILSISDTMLTFSGNATNSLILEGTANEVNAALTSLIYLPNQNYNGSDLVDVTATDLTNSQIANDSVAISITPAVDGAIVNVTNPVTGLQGVLIPLGLTVSQAPNGTETIATAFSIPDGVTLQLNGASIVNNPAFRFFTPTLVWTTDFSLVEDLTVSGLEGSVQLDLEVYSYDGTGTAGDVNAFNHFQQTHGLASGTPVIDSSFALVTTNTTLTFGAPLLSVPTPPPVVDPIIASMTVTPTTVATTTTITTAVTQGLGFNNGGFGAITIGFTSEGTSGDSEESGSNNPGSGLFGPVQGVFEFISPFGTGFFPSLGGLAPVGFLPIGGLVPVGSFGALDWTGGGADVVSLDGPIDQGEMASVKDTRSLLEQQFDIFEV